MTRFATIHDYSAIKSLIDRSNTPNQFNALTTFIIVTTSNVSAFSQYHIVVYIDNKSKELMGCMLVDTSLAILHCEQICISESANITTVLVAFHLFLNSHAKEHNLHGFSVTFTDKKYEDAYADFAEASDRYVSMCKSAKTYLEVDEKCKTRVMKRQESSLFNKEAKYIKDFATKEHKGTIAATCIDREMLLNIYDFHYGISEDIGRESYKQWDTFMSYLLSVEPSAYLSSVRLIKIVCKYDKNYIGYAVVENGTFSEGNVEILDFYVQPKYLNTKLPMMFLSCLINMAKANKKGYISSKCITTGDVYLHNLYRQAGFRSYSATLVFLFKDIQVEFNEVQKTVIF